MSGSLWESLGGENTMWKVIDDFVDRAMRDPKVTYTRKTKYRSDDPRIARFKKSAFDFLSAMTGGPYHYRGLKLTEIRRRFEITDFEFEALAAHLKAALEKHGVSADHINLLQLSLQSLSPILFIKRVS